MEIFYYLNPDHTYRESNAEEWAQQFEQLDREVNLYMSEGYVVSTVWIGVAQRLETDEEEPLLFETMIFEPDGFSIYCEKYSSWEEALEGHEDAIEWLENELCHAVKIGTGKS